MLLRSHDKVRYVTASSRCHLPPTCGVELLYFLHKEFVDTVALYFDGVSFTSPFQLANEIHYQQ
jgi:hypothetical protein